jgi:hypothetical protein
MQVIAHGALAQVTGAQAVSSELKAVFGWAKGLYDSGRGRIVMGRINEKGLSYWKPNPDVPGTVLVRESTGAVYYAGDGVTRYLGIPPKSISP